LMSPIGALLEARSMRPKDMVASVLIIVGRYRRR
jgi:hypothetical protein